MFERVFSLRSVYCSVPPVPSSGVSSSRKYLVPEAASTTLQLKQGIKPRTISLVCLAAATLISKGLPLITKRPYSRQFCQLLKVCALAIGGVSSGHRDRLVTGKLLDLFDGSTSRHKLRRERAAVAMPDLVFAICVPIQDRFCPITAQIGPWESCASRQFLFVTYLE